MYGNSSDDVARSRALARVLDSAVGIPGTRIRMGLDAILGLIPGAGDMVGATLSGYIVLAAVRAGASRAVLLRMIGNIAIDTVIGSVPLLGDLFDVGFKANMRNAAILERLNTEPAAVTKNSRRLAVMVVVLLLVLIAALGVLGFLALRLVWRLLTSG